MELFMQMYYLLRDPVLYDVIVAQIGLQVFFKLS